MRKVKKSIEDAIGYLEELIQNRHQYFEARSDNWQESEKGSEYLEKTESFEEMLDNLMDFIEQQN